MQEASEVTVLVIEDSPSFARAISAMLEYYSAEPPAVLIANSMGDALSVLSSEKVDLVILDLSLPDSSGLESIIAVKSAKSGVPIIVLTGLDDDKLAIEALKIGAQDYLAKPEINARLLNRAINYALTRGRAMALEAERMRLFEQREDFMATLTHDLKNPLIGTNRIIDLMVSEQLGKIPNQHMSLLMKIGDSNRALLAMIQNLVEVYRYEKDVYTLVREDIDLCSVLNRHLDEVRPLLNEKSIRLNTEMNNDCELMADKNSIARVIQNLIGNAIKFTPSGGLIDVKLWKEKGNALFQVSDSGPGIAEEELHRLFQRFWQGRLGKNFAHGTGLGLYLCRQIVEAHNGSIWCTSQQHHGSTFTFSIPQNVPVLSN